MTFFNFVEKLANYEFEKVKGKLKGTVIVF